MKKNRIRICTLIGALLAAIGAAQAQSSLTLFGTVDMALTHVHTDGKSRTGLAHSGANISRFGLRGIEDIGDGLKAGFWLEAGFQANSGHTAVAGSLFNRRATVSLLGDWGELRLGRDDSASFLNTLIFDPFLTNGVGGTNTFLLNGAPTIQISNAISYFLPSNLGGFYGQFQHAFKDRAADGYQVTAGTYDGVRLGWRDGPWNVSGAAARRKALTTSAEQQFANLALSYDFEVARPMLLWASHKRGDVTVRGLQLGVKVPVGGAGELRASAGTYRTLGSPQGQHANWRKFAIGYAHNFSRRTQVYSTVALVQNAADSRRAVSAQGLATPPNELGRNASGYEVGIRHFF